MGQGAVSVLETTGKIVAPLLASHVLIPNFDQPHQFNGMVYLVAGLIVAPGVLLAGMLTSVTTHVTNPASFLPPDSFAVDTEASLALDSSSIELPTIPETFCPHDS